MCADTIELEVHCIGCNNLIETPSQAEQTLFRSGVFVHNSEDCINQAAIRLGVDG